MINNVSLKEMAAFLLDAQSVLIFPHTGIDADALGSAAALCRGLRSLGKTAWVLTDEEIPRYISFMDTEYCTLDKAVIEAPDVCICVDCSEESRFPGLADKYREGKLQLCIDHHATGGSFGDYYYIDGAEAATSQLIHKLLPEMGITLDKAMSESLYAGISSDTGSFQYSNTSAETHSIAAELLETGIDHMKITVSLYQTVSLKKVQLESDILNRMEIVAGGRGAISCVTDEMLDQYGATLDDAEGAIDKLRNIEGVEVAAFLKEKGGTVKVSMRSKSLANVDRIAVKFGGGGHAKAAGCTLDLCMDDALALIKKEIKEYLNN